MTFTVIEYRDEVEHSRAEVTNASEFGQFIMQRVEELDLVFNDETEVYQMPNGQVVRFAFSQESGLSFLRKVLGSVENTEEVEHE